MHKNATKGGWSKSKNLVYLTKPVGELDVPSSTGEMYYSILNISHCFHNTFFHSLSRANTILV